MTSLPHCTFVPSYVFPESLLVLFHEPASVGLSRQRSEPERQRRSLQQERHGLERRLLVSELQELDGKLSKLAELRAPESERLVS